MRLLSRFVKDECAATAIEYALIAGGISVAIATVVQTVGTQLSAKFTSVANSLK
jgi:pilus assembly protein Flp/PilA